MSKSRRRPFSAVTGVRSAKQDKQMASRAVRRRHNQYLKTQEDMDDFLLPHRLECGHNEVYGWSRDGRQRYQVPDHRCWSRYVAKIEGYHPYETRPYTRFPYMPGEVVWPPDWYPRLLRK
jgi:hypothetical protein